MEEEEKFWLIEEEEWKKAESSKKVPRLNNQLRRAQYLDVS